MDATDDCNLDKLAEPMADLVLEDSVPTDLTVSVSGQQQTADNSENSLGGPTTTDVKCKGFVKRLQSDIQFQKLALAQKNALLEKLESEKRTEIELLKSHILLANRENEALKNVNNQLETKLSDIQTSNVRLQSENIVLEETVTKLKAEVADWERKWSSLNERFNEILLQINRNEFTYDQFERYRQSETFLKKQIDSMAEKHCSLEQENLGLRKSANKWHTKYMHLRSQYERKLNDEISKLRQSLQKQVDMLRESSTEALELRLIEAEQSRSKAAKQVHLLRSQNEELKSRLKNEELIREKNRLERNVIETTTNELKQRVSSLNAVKCRLEREILENRNLMQEAIDSLKLESFSHQRRSNELQLQLDTQSKTIKDLEEAVLGFGNGNETSGWPTLMKIQCQHALRMTKRVAQLETENDMLQNQCRMLGQSIQQLESELDSKNQLLAQLKNGAPETIGLFRDKDAQLRELRSQLNRKDVQLMENIRQIEKLKRMRNQLATDLEKVLRDRTELETVRRLLGSSQNSINSP